MGKQNTASAGAPRDDATKWARVEWAQARREVRRLQVRIAKAVDMIEVRSWGAQQGYLSGMLEPYDGKLSRTVLRGTRGRKAPWSTRYEELCTPRRTMDFDILGEVGEIEIITVGAESGIAIDFRSYTGRETGER